METKPLLDRSEIEAILPHREPFLLIDEVVELEPGSRVVARHRVRPDIMQTERSARVTPLTGVIPNVLCPTLILRAPDPLFQEGDQLLTSEDAQRAASLLHQARVVDVPGTNHYTIALGTPAGTISAIRAFLE